MSKPQKTKRGGKKKSLKSDQKKKHRKIIIKKDKDGDLNTDNGCQPERWNHTHTAHIIKGKKKEKKK